MRKKMFLAVFSFTGVLCLIPFLSSAYAWTLPDTGQHKCYDSFAEIPCPNPGEPFYGQDAQYQGPEPTYQDNGDGTVTDLNTGLLWQQSDDGLRRTWADAASYCQDLELGGRIDWRLPTRHELFSIVSDGYAIPTISTIFVSVPDFYWSANVFSTIPDRIWGVHFATGLLEWTGDNRNWYTRCVAGNTDNKILIDNQDGTVDDTFNKLMWQKSDDSNNRNWDQAFLYCEDLILAGYNDWRLPNVRELESIVDCLRYDPTIDPIFDAHPNFYWSSSTAIGSPNNVWGANFSDGVVSLGGKGNVHYVRCVREGLLAPEIFYQQECQEPLIEIFLDASELFNYVDDYFSFIWTSDCPDSYFDDPNSAKPILYIPASSECFLNCKVSLLIEDGIGRTNTGSAFLTISDSYPPDIKIPENLIIECHDSTDPSNTGRAIAVDKCCGSNVAISYSDEIQQGNCPQEKMIFRTWRAVDACGLEATGEQIITIVDTIPPKLSLPLDVTIQCDQSSDPTSTGSAIAIDNCDSEVEISYSDIVESAGFDGEKIIKREWRAIDNCGNIASCFQSINIVDSTPPLIECNAPTTISPVDVPISFAVTTTDNCDDAPSVEIKNYRFFKANKKGKIIDKLGCDAYINDNNITILDSCGVGTFFEMTVCASDTSGNHSTKTFLIEVIKP